MLCQLRFWTDIEEKEIKHLITDTIYTGLECLYWE